MSKALNSAETKVTHLIGTREFSYSFEITPDIKIGDIEELSVDPLFYSITWHAKLHECIDLEIAPLKLAVELQSKGKCVLLHLACTLLRKEYLDRVLRLLQENRICNLFLVLGEQYTRNESDFENTTQLIKYIRKQTGSYFCIGVAGFPECSEDKLLQLKGKIDSGADFIITQAFFEPDKYKNYIEKCEAFDIKVPIVPGIYLFETYKEINGFINLCKVKVTEDLLNYVKSKGDDEKPGLDIVKYLINDIRNFGNIAKHFHFFTLNKLHRVSTFMEVF